MKNKLVINSQEIDISKIEQEIIKIDKYFSEEQLFKIILGIKKGLDVQIYANPQFNCDQMEQIMLGLEQGLDISIYNDINFNAQQMEKIRLGLIEGVEVQIYANPNYSYFSMGAILSGLKQGYTSIKKYITPEHDFSQIREIIIGTSYDLDITKFCDVRYGCIIMSLIIHSLLDGKDLSLYITPNFSIEQAYQVDYGLKSGVDVTQYNDYNISSNDMMIKRIGLEEKFDTDKYLGMNITKEQLKKSIIWEKEGKNSLKELYNMYGIVS